MISWKNKPFLLLLQKEKWSLTFHSVSRQQSIAVLDRRQRREKFEHSINLFPVVFFAYTWLLWGCLQFQFWSQSHTWHMKHLWTFLWLLVAGSLLKGKCLQDLVLLALCSLAVSWAAQYMGKHRESLCGSLQMRKALQCTVIRLLWVSILHVFQFLM